MQLIRERRPAVPEEHVIGIWLRELHPERLFRARGGEEVRVLEAGRRNRHDGPDFLDATVVIDGVLRRGSIEVHVREGDWRRHRHHLNARYDDVVLHVCLYAEGQSAEGPPLLVLATQMQEPLRRAWARARQPRSPLRCRSADVRPDPQRTEAMITLAAAERFERKCARLQARWKQLTGETAAGGNTVASGVSVAGGTPAGGTPAGGTPAGGTPAGGTPAAGSMTEAAAFRQAVYEAVARAAGYGGNEDAFERLARVVPLHMLSAARASGRQEMLTAVALGERSASAAHPVSAGNAAAASRPAAAGNPAASGNSASAVDEKLHSHDWHVSGVLPGNRPRPRMRWLADWAAQLERPAWWRTLFAAIDQGVITPAALAPLFASRVRTGSPGPERMFELAVNVLAPAVYLHARAKGLDRLAAAAADLFFQLAPAPQNRHTRIVTRALEVPCDRALHQQGMIELYTGFCTQGRCGGCLLGSRGRG